VSRKAAIRQVAPARSEPPVRRGARDDTSRAFGQQRDRAREPPALVVRDLVERHRFTAIASYQIARRSSDSRSTRCTSGPPAAAMLRNRSIAASASGCVRSSMRTLRARARVAAHGQTRLGRAPQLAVSRSRPAAGSAAFISARSLVAGARPLRRPRALSTGHAATASAISTADPKRSDGALASARSSVWSCGAAASAQQRRARRRLAQVLPDQIGTQERRPPRQRLEQRRAQRVKSAAAPIGALLICSGDMYASVPRKPPDCVWPKSARCAPPKSPSFALPATSKKTFAGLTSR
jgi:hypothetical protein